MTRPPREVSRLAEVVLAVSLALIAASAFTLWALSRIDRAVTLGGAS